jgi:hypothetical protein
MDHVESQFVEGSDTAVLGEGGEREVGEGQVDQVLWVVDTAQFKQLHVLTLQVTPFSHVTLEGTCDVSLGHPLPWSPVVVTVTEDNLHEGVVHVVFCIRRGE